jgi:hypothetical protein
VHSFEEQNHLHGDSFFHCALFQDLSSASSSGATEYFIDMLIFSCSPDA